jgi:hypothetical protein
MFYAQLTDYGSQILGCQNRPDNLRASVMLSVLLVVFRSNKSELCLV